MTLHNTALSYGRAARALHWLTAALILTLIPLGFVAENLSHAINAPGAMPTQAELARVVTLFSLHKTLGVLTFLIALLRLGWMLVQTRPAPLHPNRRTETLLAETIHYALYGALVAVPLSGWVHHAATTGFAPIWGLGQSLPFVPKDATVAQVASTLHEISVFVMIGALALHIAGALKHHLLDRDGTLARMTRGTPAGAAHQSSAALPLLAAAAVWALVPVGAGSVGLFQPGATPAPALDQVSSDWQVTDGTLSLAITQMGNRVEGQFSDWTAQISFADDPAQPKNGQITVTVSIPSLTLGGVTEQAMGPDYFDATAFPTAVFTADILRAEQGFVADGTLSIKDQTVPLSLPFTLTLDGDTATATGVTATDRRSFAIGDQVPEESTLGFGVDIRFALTASRG